MNFAGSWIGWRKSRALIAEKRSSGMLGWIVSSSILIAAVIVGRYFLRGRVSRRLQYGLWLLVALRLLIPVSPLHSPLRVDSLFSGLPAQRETIMDLSDLAVPVSVRSEGGSDQISIAGEQAMRLEGGFDHTSTTGERATRSEDGSDQTSAAGERTVRSEDGSDQTLTAGEHTYVAAGSAAPTAGIQGSHHMGNKNIPYVQKENTAGGKSGIRTAAGYIWLTGTCALALWLAAVNGVFRYKVRRDRQPVKIPENRDGRRALPVFVTDRVGSPCMYGLLCPTVYITPAVEGDPRLLAAVLCHEQTHYRQGDHLWAVIRSLCLCIHWYNPLVWAAVNLSRQDGEMACDEGVLRKMGVERRGEYGEALLALSAGIKPSLSPAMNLATSMSATKRQLRERLSALATAPKMAAGKAVLVVLIFAVLALGAFTSNAYNGGDSTETDRIGVLCKKRSGYDRADTGRQTGTPVASPGEPESMERKALPLESGEPGESGDMERQSQPLEPESVYDSWDARILWYFDEDQRPVAEISEGDTVIKLTFVETFWSFSAQEQPYSREILYWACQALRELEQWTGTRITEACYSVSELIGYNFALTPEDMQHDRIFYNRCYNHLFGDTEIIENIRYSTDMDVWFSPVKQYVMPPGYDKMTKEEILTWFFERSEMARGSQVEEIIRPWEGDYILRTDQGTYYEYTVDEGDGFLGRSISIYGPYDSYPEH